MGATVAAEAAPAEAAFGAADAGLTLADAERLALERQPLLDAQRATVRAARERAVAMRQLPDPMLIAGVQNLPVSGEDRYDFGMDEMTMTTVGLEQQVPLPAKRRLRGKAEALMADAGEARLAMLERSVRRDAAMAWVEAWFPQRAAELAAAMAVEAERERAAADIAYRAGRAPQADVLAADVELEMLRDRVRKLNQDAARARAKLARWIGEPMSDQQVPGQQLSDQQVPGQQLSDQQGSGQVQPLWERPMAATVPPLPDPPALDALLTGLDRHPELAEAAVEVSSAENQVALAREMRWPDWRVEAMYGFRQEYDEMLTVQLGIDLPLFRGNRQDREIGAAREQVAASQATREDMQRQLRAMAASAWQSWSEARNRLTRYDEAIVPRAHARAEAALAAYRAGNAELMAVIGARRGALEATLMRLELQMEVLNQLIELRYLDTRGEAS